MKTKKTSSTSWQNKLISTALAAVSLLVGLPQSAYATLPTVAGNLQVSAGSLTGGAPVVTNLNSTGLPESMLITTSTTNTALTWANFSDGTGLGGMLGSNDTITFTVPANGGVLNNITGGPTILGGRINSNGNVFFLNPAGIVVGGSSIINVNGFYASTITDAGANSYFYSTGTLGVFAGVAQPVNAVSGMIYIQSGSSIATAPGSGQVQLASNSTGGSITYSSGASTSGTSSAITLNNGSYSSVVAGNLGTVGGITIDNLNASNLTVISNNAGSTFNTGTGGITLTQGYATTGGPLQGGNLTIATNGGSVLLNGPVVAQGNATISTSNSGPALTSATTANITATANVAVTGSLSLTTNGGNITANYSNAGINYTLNSGLNSNINAGYNTSTPGNIQIYGDIKGLTNVNGSTVTVSLANPAISGNQRTISSITSSGALTVNATGDLAITTLNSLGQVTVNSFSGAVNIGSTSIASTINATGQQIVQGYNGVTLTNLNINQNGYAGNGTLIVRSLNSAVDTVGAVSPIKLASVTMNGAITANTLSGSITLTTVNINSPLAANTTLTTNNGTILLQNVVTQNGNFILTAGDNPSSSALQSYGLTLTNVTNNTSKSGVLGSASFVDTYTTNNGNIQFTAYNSLNVGVSANTGLNVTGNAVQLGNITTSGVLNSFGGPLYLTTNNGAITMTSISITPNIITRNAVYITSNNSFGTAADNIKVTALTDLYVNNVTMNNGQNWAYSNTASQQSVTLTSTGNLQIANPIVAQSITLSAGAGLVTSNIDSTSNTSSVISITAGNDLNTTYISMNQGPSKTLTLISSTGNVYFTSTNNMTTSNAGTLLFPAVTLCATTGNVNISGTGSSAGNNGFATTLNGSSITITAGNTISLTAGTLNSNNSNSNGTLTVSAPSVSLVGPNLIPNLIVSSGANGVTINTASSTTNFGTGTNVTGNLVLNSSGNVNFGTLANDTITVTGLTTINTVNAGNNGNTGFVNTVSSGINLFGGVSVTTNGGPVTLGTAGGNANFGQIVVSTANSTSAPKSTATIYENGIANLGATNVTTLNVTATGIINTSGTISATNEYLNSSTVTSSSVIINGNTVTTTTTVPGSITIGSLNPSNLTGTLTIVGGNNVTVNQNTGSSLTINATGQAMNNVNYSNFGTGNMTYTGTGGSVSNVIGYTNSGILTYTSTNATLGSGSLTTNTGSVSASFDGTGNQGAVVINLGNATGTSTIKYGSVPTVSNVTSTSGETGAINFTGNVNSVTPAQGTLTIGNGISLLGNGAVTFCSGNAQTTGVTPAGGITDTGTTGMTLNAKSVSFVGKTISVTSLLNSYNSLGTTAFTSNGSVSITENNNIILAASSLNSSASGSNYIASQTGNITQTGLITIQGSNSPISFTSAPTGNMGVVLNQTNNINSSSKNLIGISASGNSVLVTNNDIYLGNVVINPSSTTPVSTDSQLTVSAGFGTTGNIAQGTGTTIYSWGNANFTSTGSKGISLTNLGNNFGALTVSAGYTGNVSITETATSAYNTVSANNFTANSYAGDIITATSNSGMTISGNSALSANNITLTAAGNMLSGSTGTILLAAKSNATIVDSNYTTTLLNGTNVAGNLTVTNRTSGALLTDQSGSSGVTVGAIATLKSAAISFTGSNNAFGGLITTSTLSNTVKVLGNLVLLPGSISTYGYFTATGNISTSGAGSSGFTNLNLSAGGNVDISKPFSEIVITGSLVISAPGFVNLSALSTYADFANGSIIPVINGTATNVATGTYTPPNP